MSHFIIIKMPDEASDDPIEISNQVQEVLALAQVDADVSYVVNPEVQQFLDHRLN